MKFLAKMREVRERFHHYIQTNRRAARVFAVLAVIGKCLATIGITAIITLSLVVSTLAVMIVVSFRNNADVLNLSDIGNNGTSIVYVKDAEGNFNEYTRLQGAKSVWASYDRIPDNLKNAVIAIEDERFPTHNGVDWKRTASAAANLVLHFSSNEYGGSTITQQLIKVVTNENDHSIQRKITEIFRALDLERSRYTKNDILEAYLNVIPLSDNYIGVGAGANYYFAKDVSDLSLAECAVLASITNNPSKYDPYRHPENVRTRQHLVLKKMYDLHYITLDEFKQAVNEELVFRSDVRAQKIQDYYVDLLIEDLVDDLSMKYGYSKSYAQSLVFYGGLKIYSAEQPELQAEAEKIYANDKNFPASYANDTNDPNAAIFVMDYSGRVVVTVGARGEKTANRALNRSTQSRLQPGSCIKPLSAYAPAIKNDIIHFSSFLRDAPITLPDGTLYPSNYGSSVKKDRGNKMVPQALQVSLNTVPVQLIKKMGLQRSFSFLTNTLNMTSLIESESINGVIHSDIAYGPLALGGFTYGVYAREMAAAYAVFGNGGIYNKPYTYYYVEQRGAKILETGDSSYEAIDEETAYVMNRLLQLVVQGGTASDIASSWKGMEVFAKTGTTGTTTEGRNVYFMGGTPYCVGASWFGYDYNQTLRDNQTKYARSLWNKVMLMIHEGLENASFEKKGETMQLRYCTETGLLATKGCPKTGTGVYKPSNTPGYCNKHAGDPLDKKGTTSSSTETGPDGETTTTTDGWHEFTAVAPKTTTGKTSKTTTTTTTTTAKTTTKSTRSTWRWW